MTRVRIPIEAYMNVKIVENYATKEFKSRKMEWFIELHLKPMKKFALKLAETLDADKEIVEISVWLHDITHTEKGAPHDHPKVNSEFAEKFLAEKGFDRKTIQSISQCILNHGCHEGRTPKTTEEKIISSADAMAHIANFEALLFVAFYMKNYSPDKTYTWLKDKIERDWNKKILLPQAKEMVKERYEQIRILLGAMGP